MAPDATPYSKTIFNETYKAAFERFENMKKRILSKCSKEVKKIIVIHQCEFESSMRTIGTPIYQFFLNTPKGSEMIGAKKPPQMVPRAALKGGAVQLMRVLARSCNRYVVRYADLNSLYPDTAIRKKFVTGPGIHLLGPKMLSCLTFDTEKNCWFYHDPADNSVCETDGIVQCVVGIDPQNHALNSFPFLPLKYPRRGKNFQKTFRVSCFACLVSKQKKLCTHDMNQRKFSGVYTLSEIAYSLELGYKLIELQEAIVFKNLEYVFSDFMRFLASRKIRFSKVPSSYKQDLKKYCDFVNEKMS